MSRDVVIVDGVRTPYAKANTELKDVPAQELGRIVTAEILARTRVLLRRQLPVIEESVRGHDGVLEFIPPRAGAIALVRYRLPIGSVAFFDRLRLEKSVLITPGAHFGGAVRHWSA